MTRTSAFPAVLATTVLVLLAGCAPEPGPGPAGPATALTLPARTTTSSTTATATAPHATDDVTACADGNCEISIMEDTEIALDPGLGVERIAISDIDGDRARATLESGQSTSTSSGSSVTVVRNDLSLRMRVQGGVATVRLSTS